MQLWQRKGKVTYPTLDNGAVGWWRRGSAVRRPTPEVAAKLDEVRRGWAPMHAAVRAARSAGWTVYPHDHDNGTVSIRFRHSGGREIATTWSRAGLIRGEILGIGRRRPRQLDCSDELKTVLRDQPSDDWRHLSECPACRALDKGKG